MIFRFFFSTFRFSSFFYFILSPVLLLLLLWTKKEWVFSPLILMWFYFLYRIRANAFKIKSCGECMHVAGVYGWACCSPHIAFWFISVSSGCFGRFDRSSCLNGTHGSQCACAFSFLSFFSFYFYFILSNIITLKLILVCVSMRSVHFRASVWAHSPKMMTVMSYLY